MAKEELLKALSEMPEQVIATAYLHALNYTMYGVDVTQAWVTATQQNDALQRAFIKGHYEGRKLAHEEMKSSPEEPTEKQIAFAKKLAESIDLDAFKSKWEEWV